jgi:hypothetical protein
MNRIIANMAIVLLLNFRTMFGTKIVVSGFDHLLKKHTPKTTAIRVTIIWILSESFFNS